MSEKPLEQMGLRDLRKIMRRKAPGEAWKHFNGAAETKATFHRNPRAFRQYLFRQKIFHDVAEPDISIELFGHTHNVVVDDEVFFSGSTERLAAELGMSASPAG